jgi:hypothetical protein
MVFFTHLDISKPILTCLIEVAESNGGKLSDSDFGEVLQAYGIPLADEEGVMSQMQSATTYKFARGKDGWEVTDLSNFEIKTGAAY